MNIAIMNTQGSHGGAARAALRLHLGMLEEGVNSNYLVKKGWGNIAFARQMKTSKSEESIEMLVQKFYVDANRSKLTDTYFSFNYTNADIRQNEFIDEADIVNLHWIDKFMGDRSLKALVEKQKKIVWTLHDEKPYTGGCHYTAGCTKFIDTCEGCPQLEYDPFNITSRVLEAKKSILKDANLTIVTPSVWLAEEARKSTLFKNFRIETIPNSIEIDVFKPENKKDAKKSLGIPEDTITLMFGAHVNKAKRKGFTSLMEAMNLCFKNSEFQRLCETKKINIVTVGIPNKEIDALPIDVFDFGFISDDKKMAKIYNATNIFILPSLEDNLPNTMIEAFSCETAVVGFDTGGIPDVVHNDKNGYVVAKGDSKALSMAILKAVFNPDKMEEFGKSGRKLIEEKFKLSDQTTGYLDLFKEILGKEEVEKKNNFDTLNEEHYDSIIGYAHRKSLLEKDAQVNASELYSYIQEISNHKILKKPIKKLRAYKKMMSEFKKVNK